MDNQNWYVCGPTIYNDSHLGHARTYILFDVLRRVCAYQNKKINYCMNITDIDDKIINKVKLLHWSKLIDNKEIANDPAIMENYLLEHGFTEEQMTPSYNFYKSFIDEQETRFWQDMRALDVILPNHIIRVTDIVPDIIEFVSVLIGKGLAYESNNSVYFNMTAFINKFGKNYDIHNLENSNLNDKELKNKFNQEKKNKQDFALWKAAKKYEIKYKSPWGYGRCGWSIECSVMINKIFDSKLTLHCGGIDLRYPHNAHEYVQTLAYTENKNWVEKFAYVGHLHISGQKMSQSLKNFTTIKEFMKKYNARQIRILFLLHHWNKPMELNNETINEMILIDKKILEFTNHLQFILSQRPKNHNEDKEYNDAVNHFESEFNLNLQNDYNFPNIFVAIRKIITDTYSYLNGDYNSSIIENFYNKFISKLKIFGLNYENKIECDNKIFKDAIISIRNNMRELARTIRDKQIKNQVFGLADWIRDVQVKELGFDIEDTQNGTKIK